MIIHCRLKTTGKPGTDQDINFFALPHKGDLINPDAHGRGIHGLIDEIIWVWCEENLDYYPYLTIKVYNIE
jgi:hypothetical protein